MPYSLAQIPPPTDRYWGLVHRMARQLKSDGCTGVPDWYLDACLEHDCHWRLRTTLWGDPISRTAANTRFRRVIQSRSRLGRCSPLSWWRWAAVSVYGQITP